jgi:hypothetical protein
LRRKFSVLCALVLSVLTLSVAGSIKAQDTAGTLKVTFIRNKESNDKVMAHTWGNDHSESGGIKAVSQNGVVVNFEFKVGAKADDKMGFIPVLEKADGTQDWDNKLSYGGADLKLDVTGIKGNGGVKHAVLFENAKEGEVVYSSVNPTGYVVFLSYFAASYEENLGIHNWNWSSENAASWGSPLQVFETVGRAGDGAEVKGAILECDDIASAGLLIYAGGDDSKKHAAHGDIKKDSGDFEGAEKGVLYPVAVCGGNVFNNAMTDFVNDAFKFKLIGYAKDEAGYDTGTFATNKTNIIVKTSADVVVPMEKDGAALTTAERTAIAGGYFTITEKGTSNTVEVDHADFNQFATSGVKDFVVVLKQELDNTKEYVLSFNNGAGKEAEIELSLDTQAPEIVIVSPNDYEVISVPFNQKFDMSLFPTYVAVDDRDGDITNLVYVPKGQGYLNTNKKGDYPITLRVEDKWGNVTELTFTFRVE